MNIEKEKLFKKLVNMVYVENKEITPRQERVLKRLSDEDIREKLECDQEFIDSLPF